MSDDVLAEGLLKDLDREAAAEMLRQAERRTVSAEGVLFTAGQPARAVHVIVSGVVRLVQVTPSGPRVIIKYVRPGEVFGSPALLDRFYPTSAIAVTECVELQWSSATIKAFVDGYPQLALNVIRDLETRLREMESRLRDLSTEPVEQRLARAILRLVETFGRQTAEGVEIPFPVSRQDLADLIGSTLHMVSRTLRAWEAQRRIGRYRRRLVIADVEAVARTLYREA
ncbi:Crp/Fnr family transcriptional regulator [Microvirga soli]|jgi:CRP/FNR family transcriptional regulator, nitrogen oxide reductase regulator|uniref:Crp/Fnr family transcriptional regulator n=1 Tax=Microvirga soli TaxID=1854496 RepID=UPI00191E84EB|nr:Crp/Fnr family transcriptional regulator [Microvirga soli]